MIIEYLSLKINTKTDIKFKCDRCGNIYVRNNKSYIKMQKNKYYDKDYCLHCWRKILNNRPEYKKNMSFAVREAHEKDPFIRDRISKALIESGANKGDKNGMKQLEARQKVSKARKKMFSDPKLRKEYSAKTMKAWAEGKFDGVRVGQCKWYRYKHSNGEEYKVQGTWELAFIKWLDENNIDFKCHRGRVPYKIKGKDKNYYPDFWIYDWNSYVDVKCRHFYSEEKFDAIQDSNPGLKVKVLFKKDLVKLGVII